MFKFNKVFLAVAVTLFAGQAFAAPVTQAQINTARNQNNINEAWISGASAPTYNVFQGFAAGCDANTLSAFYATPTSGSGATVSRPGASASSNFLAYACTRGGVVSVLYHTIDGGSFNAFAPHIPNDVDGDGVTGTTKLRRIAKLGSNTGCVAQTGTPLSLKNQSSIPTFTGCAVNTPANTTGEIATLPAGGFSDVEAALFGVSTEGFGTENNANVGQVFGVATSTSLYRAMQVAQGIYATEAAAIAGDPNFLPANAPSISHVQYASIVSGTANASLLVPGSTAPLTIARRVATSGTQASSNATFLRNPCNGDAVIAGALQPIGLADSSAQVIVTEGSGTGNAKSALSTSGYAIGVLSLENDWNADTSSNGYRFIKLDNIHPEAPIAGSGQTKDAKARYTAAQGLYDFHMELKTFVANSAAGTFGEKAINDIVGAFPGLDCADVPRGLTLNPFAGSSCTVGQVVARGSRNGNNCQPQQLF